MRSGKSLAGDLREAVIRNAGRFVPEQRAFVQDYNRRLETVLRQRGMIVNAAGYGEL